jgi:hypothetical protein
MVSLSLIDASRRGITMPEKKKKWIKKAEQETLKTAKPSKEDKKSRSSKEVRNKLYGSKE